jgi:hypothetical protein
MDPDILVAELNVDSDTLIDVLWEQVENYIEENYDDNQEQEDSN